MYNAYFVLVNTELVKNSKALLASDSGSCLRFLSARMQ